MYTLLLRAVIAMRGTVSPATSQGEHRDGVRSMLYAVLVGCMVISLSTGIATAETKRVKEYGMLISVETDGTVVIDKSGYEVASYARIVNSAGKTVSLKDFQLPTKVYFEYDYTNKGAVIKRITEIAQ